MKTEQVRLLLNRLYERLFMLNQRLLKLDEIKVYDAATADADTRLDDALRSTYQNERGFVSEQINGVLEALGSES